MEERSPERTVYINNVKDELRKLLDDNFTIKKINNFLRNKFLQPEEKQSVLILAFYEACGDLVLQNKKEEAEALLNSYNFSSPEKNEIIRMVQIMIYYHHNKSFLF